MVSDKDHDYVKDGFIAATRDRGEEDPRPGAVHPHGHGERHRPREQGRASPAPPTRTPLKARKDELGRIQKEIQDKTGLTAEAVTLYQGGEYWMYRYKKHTDVRLVMAPEQQVAFFGGDSDNFTYPRYNLDFTLFRVYEDGKPYHPAHHLAWTATGVEGRRPHLRRGPPRRHLAPGDLGPDGLRRRFRDAHPHQAPGAPAAGHAGLRQVSPESARQVNTQIFGLENSIKAMNGYLAGLQGPGGHGPHRQGREGAQGQGGRRPHQAGRAAGPPSRRPSRPRRASTRRPRLQRPQRLRLREHAPGLRPDPGAPRRRDGQAFRRSAWRSSGTRNLESLKKRLLVNRPFYPALETAMFTFGLKEAREPAPAAAREGHPRRQDPRRGAKAAVEGSKLNDPAVRKALMEGGRKAILDSQDPMILLARKVDAPNRAFRKKLEDQVTSVLTEHGGRIAQARFKAYGKSVYPDATFTLRMTYGPVASYPANGTHIQPFTTFGGMYDRAAAWGPEAENGAWALPKRWIDKRDKVNPDTPFVFAHAVDIIGGNSGSPVIDTQGRAHRPHLRRQHRKPPRPFLLRRRREPRHRRGRPRHPGSPDKVYDDQPIVKEIRGN